MVRFNLPSVNIPSVQHSSDSLRFNCWYVLICSVCLGAMKDSIDSVKKGFPALLPEPDEMGRAILYNDWNLIEVDAATGKPMNMEEVRSNV